AGGDVPGTVSLNADGRPDRAAGGSGSGVVGRAVLRGNGDGSFPPPIRTATPPYPTSYVLADFNADGRPDAAVTSLYGTLSVLLNDGHWPPEAPSVSIGDTTMTEGNSGTASATFTLTLSYATNVSVTVHYV